MGTAEDSRPLAYSRYEAADALGIGVKTLDRWIRAGRIRSVKVSSRVFIPATSLEALLEGTPAHDPSA